MRSTLAVLALVALLALSLPISAGAVTADDISIATYGEHGHESFLVEYEDGSFDSVQAWADGSDRRVIRDHYNASNRVLVSAPTFEVRAPNLGERASMAARFDRSAITRTTLTDRSYVVSVEPNYELPHADPVDLENESAFDTPDTPFRMQARALVEDHPASINTVGIAFSKDAERTDQADSQAILDADTVSQSGNGTVVAPIDTGCNVADGQIIGNGSVGSELRLLNASKNTITGETVGDNGTDAIADGSDSRHGSWVMSAIAANASNDRFDGMAPDASVLCLKALGDDGSGETADIVEAVRYAADNDADVISMSLGSPLWSDELEAAVEYAVDQGSVVFIAVGNSRQTARWTASPADAQMEGVIAVQATNTKSPANASAAYFGQLGPDPGTIDDSGGDSAGAQPEIAAPGMETAALVADTNGFVTDSEGEALSGTSMATPKAAGAALLLLEAEPALEPAEVEDRLTSTAEPIPNASTSEVGHGMVNVENAITDTEPNETQQEAMTDEAEARDLYYDKLSDYSGGFVTKFLAVTFVVAIPVGRRYAS